MKKIEYILIIFVLIGIALKHYKIDGGASLIVLSFLLLSATYLVFSFAILNGISFKHIFRKNAYSGIEASEIIIASVVGIFLALSVIGICFPIMNWQGASTVLLSNILSLSPVVLISFIFSLVKKSRLSYRVLVRSAIYMLVSIVAFLLIKRWF